MCDINCDSGLVAGHWPVRKCLHSTYQLIFFVCFSVSGRGGDWDGVTQSLFKWMIKIERVKWWFINYSKFKVISVLNMEETMEDSVNDDIEEDKDQVALEYIKTGDFIA